MKAPIIADVENYYAIQVAKAFNYDGRASKALGLISQQLSDDFYNFIEPDFFDFKFIVIKSFTDQFILPKSSGTNIIMNKSVLLEKNSDVLIQVFDDKNIYLWENMD